MVVQRLKDGRLRDRGTGRILKDATPSQKDLDEYKKTVEIVNKLWAKKPKALGPKYSGNIPALNKNMEEYGLWFDKIQPIMVKAKKIQEKYGLSEKEMLKMANAKKTAGGGIT